MSDPTTMEPTTSWPTTSPADSDAEASDGAETVEDTEPSQEGSQAPQNTHSRRPRIGVTATRDLMKRSTQMQHRFESFFSAFEKMGITPGMQGQTGIRAELVAACSLLHEASQQAEEAHSYISSVSETVESLYENL